MPGKRSPQTILTGNDDDQPGLHIAAISASAGGKGLLIRLFSVMPEDTGIAYVIVTHQREGGITLLPELLQGLTRIPVMEASQTVQTQDKGYHGD